MGLLQSIAIHDILHPGVGMAGAMRMPRMSAAAMGAPPTGSFIDKLTGSPLGQIGMALLAGGGGPLGNTAQLLMQQNMMQRLYGARSGPHFEHVGNTIGILDPQTGEFKPTYTAPAAEDEFTRELRAGGIDPASDEGKGMLRQRAQNMADPIVQIPLPGGQAYVGPKSGLQDALQRLSGTPAAAPGALAPPSAPPAPLAASVAGVESNNRDFNPDGSPVTSSAGAKFAMQVLPSTAHNPGFGVTPAANDTAGEYDRVGRDYLGALQRHYGGNQAEALAAYNAGPGTVDRALASGSPLPSQGYVNRAMGGNDLVAQAQAAIAAGADPVQVRARAAKMGVTVP
jgi:hypothetical protein